MKLDHVSLWSFQPYGILFLQIGFKEMVYVGYMMHYACKSKGHATADIFRRFKYKCLCMMADGAAFAKF